MRSQKEIIKEIERLSASSEDPLGLMAADLCGFLLWRNAEQFLTAEARANPAAAREVWEDNRVHAPRGAFDVIRDYQPQGWAHANGHAGVMCMHNVWHYKAWLWMLGTQRTTELARNLHVGFLAYGKPQLVMVANTIGLPNWRQYDDGEWIFASDSRNTDPINRYQDYVKLTPEQGIKHSIQRNPELERFFNVDA